MVFTSHVFIFYFLPAVLLIYYLLPASRRNFFLLLASYAFYGWWQPWFMLLMVAVTIINHLSGRAMAASRDNPGRAKAALGVSVAANLVLLGFFKYCTFVGENVNRLWALFGTEALPMLQVALPVGISFYIFKSLSYSIDVYRGVSPPARSFWDFACFVSLFPQIMAGPIIRYHMIADQLVERTCTLDKFSSGVALFILGFAKKVLLANPMGEVADAAFGAAAPCAADAWFGALGYAFQIYFDFSGYSDMAVGLGRMLGFEFLKNFDAPYRAESITDLWRKWHVSLSSFLRDYLYLPLGGNRQGTYRTYANLAIVMLLGGMWHGAKWTFLAWGAWHGLLLCLERWRGKKSLYDRLPRPARIAATFVLMLLSWVLFRAADLTAAAQYFRSMLGLQAAQVGQSLLAADLYTPLHVLVMALCAVLVFQPVQAFDWSTARPQTWRRVAVLVPLFAIAVIVMFNQAFNPFLYFAF